MPSPSATTDRARVCTVPSAAQHLLRRMYIDPRLAHLLGPGSESFDLITREVAQQRGQSIDEVRRHAEANLKYQPWPSEGGAA